MGARARDRHGDVPRLRKAGGLCPDSPLLSARGPRPLGAPARPGSAGPPEPTGLVLRRSLDCCRFHTDRGWTRTGSAREPRVGGRAGAGAGSERSGGLAEAVQLLGRAGAALTRPGVAEGSGGGRPRRAARGGGGEGGRTGRGAHCFPAAAMADETPRKGNFSALVGHTNGLTKPASLAAAAVTSKPGGGGGSKKLVIKNFRGGYPERPKEGGGLWAPGRGRGGHGVESCGPEREPGAGATRDGVGEPAPRAAGVGPSGLKAPVAATKVGRE